MDISFCVVSYNTKRLLLNCIDSLINADMAGVDYEIIVIDNASADGTVDALKADFPKVRIIENDENLGYTKAMNLGFTQSSGEYVVQLNPDAEVNKHTFNTLYTWMNENPDIGIASPKVLNGDGTLQMQCRRSFARPWDVLSYFLGLHRLFPKSKKFGGYLMTYLPENEISDVEAVSGSCMFIRRDVIMQIGLLDERYFAYQEDADFCFRAKNAGWRIVYNPNAEIIHYGGLGGSRNHPYRAIYEWHKSYYLYYRKNLRKDYIFLVNWVMYLAMGIKLLFALLVAFLSKEKVVGTKKPS